MELVIQSVSVNTLPAAKYCIMPVGSVCVTQTATLSLFWLQDKLYNLLSIATRKDHNKYQVFVKATLQSGTPS